MEKCWNFRRAGGLPPAEMYRFLAFFIKWELSKTGTKRRGTAISPTVHPIFSYDNYIAKFQFDNKLS